MADDAFNQNQWPDQGKSQPKPDVDVRTFGSDIKSVSDSGGGPPKPYTPPSPPLKPPQPQKQESEAKQSFSQVFPATSPEGQEAAPAPMSFDASGLEAEGMKPKKSPKGLFVGILVLVIVVGLAALGYFFVYPVFFGAPPEEVAEVTPPTPTPSPAPEVPTVPQVPVVEEPAPEPEGEPTPPPAAVIEHVSLFKTAADVSTNIILPQVTVASYKTELDFLTAQVPILKEVVFKDSEGGFISFGSLASALLPGVFTQGLNQSFEQDFTLFTYTDSKGTWPGFVAKLEGGAVLADIQSSVSGLEASQSLANLYLTSPGSQTSWKSGTVEGVSNRYLPFSLDGASLNYGWQGDLLVVSASFSGFQEALKRLK